MATPTDAIRFEGSVRYWNPDKSAGLAVADVPGDLIAAFGGLKQQRVRGTINNREFTSSVMPAGGGRLALSVSRAMLRDAGIDVGERAEFEVTSVGRE